MSNDTENLGKRVTEVVGRLYSSESYTGDAGIPAVADDAVSLIQDTWVFMNKATLGIPREYRGQIDDRVVHFVAPESSQPDIELAFIAALAQVATVSIEPVLFRAEKAA